MSSFFAAAASRKRERVARAIEGLVNQATVDADKIGASAEEIVRIQQSIRNNYPIPSKAVPPSRPKLFIVK